MVGYPAICSYTISYREICIKMEQGCKKVRCKNQVPVIKQKKINRIVPGTKCTKTNYPDDFLSLTKGFNTLDRLKLQERIEIYKPSRSLISSFLDSTLFCSNCLSETTTSLTKTTFPITTRNVKAAITRMIFGSLF